MAILYDDFHIISENKNIIPLSSIWYSRIDKFVGIKQ